MSNHSAEYFKVHKWARKNIIGDKCEFCKVPDSQKKLQRANVSGRYLYELDDWKILCNRCHGIYDNKVAKFRITKAKRTQCINGHLYSQYPPVTKLYQGYMCKICTECRRQTKHRTYLKRKAKYGHN